MLMNRHCTLFLSTTKANCLMPFTSAHKRCSDCLTNTIDWEWIGTWSWFVLLRIFRLDKKSKLTDRTLLLYDTNKQWLPHKQEKGHVLLLFCRLLCFWLVIDVKDDSLANCFQGVKGYDYLSSVIKTRQPQCHYSSDAATATTLLPAAYY